MAEKTNIMSECKTVIKTLGDLRKATKDLSDDTRIDTIVNLTHWEDDFFDDLGCSIDIHHLDVAKEDGYIELFVFKPENA